MFIGLIQFENGMYKETRNSLKSNALAAMNLIGEVLKSQEDKVSRTKDFFGELDRSINMVTDKESNMQQNI